MGDSKQIYGAWANERRLRRIEVHRPTNRGVDEIEVLDRDDSGRTDMVPMTIPVAREMALAILEATGGVPGTRAKTTRLSDAAISSMTGREVVDHLASKGMAQMSMNLFAWDILVADRMPEPRSTMDDSAYGVDDEPTGPHQGDIVRDAQGRASMYQGGAWIRYPDADEPPWEPRRLEDLGVTVKIPWDEIAQADGPLEQQRIILREVDAQLSQPCSHCNGTGNTGFISTVRCTKCDGTGRAQ